MGIWISGYLNGLMSFVGIACGVLMAFYLITAGLTGVLKSGRPDKDI